MRIISSFELASGCFFFSLLAGCGSPPIRSPGQSNTLYPSLVTDAQASTPAEPAIATFPPTPAGAGGGRIAFASTRDDTDPVNCNAACNSEIYTMDAHGSNIRRLTYDPAWDANPAWAPDGTKIAFDSTRDGTRQIYVMNADGSKVIRLTDGPFTAEEPAWSPDGNRIAFISDRDNQDLRTCRYNGSCEHEIYIMNSDGTNIARLIHANGDEADPAWSPNGSALAYSSYALNVSRIHSIGLDGANLLSLTPDTGWALSPTWSPDGEKIAYEYGPSTGPAAPVGIWVMDADGSNARCITQNMDSTLPDWSADGERIVFVSTWVGGNGISTMNPDGSNVVRLMVDPGILRDPDWQP